MQAAFSISYLSDASFTRAELRGKEEGDRLIPWVKDPTFTGVSFYRTDGMSLWESPYGFWGIEHTSRTVK